MKTTVTHDATAQRYAVDFGDGNIAWVDYSHRGNGVIALEHSEVPLTLRGRGYGAAMMNQVLAMIDSEGLKVVPICGYTRHYLEANEQWRHLVS